MKGFLRAGSYRDFVRLHVLVGLALLASASSSLAQSFATPGANVNVGGVTTKPEYIPDLGLKQQGEPSCIVRPNNSSYVLCAYNDMRASDLALVQGDSWIGLSYSSDKDVFYSRLAPGFKGDGARSINKGFAADPLLVAIPGQPTGMAVLNYIAGFRGSSDSVLAIQRLVEFPREDQDFWKPEDQVRIIADSFTDDGFIDKPAFFYLLDAPGQQSLINELVVVEGESGPVEVTTPSGTLFVVYAVFPENREGSKLLLRRSRDNGKTWSQAVTLADGTAEFTGASISALGEQIVVTYRRSAVTVRRRVCDDDDDDDDDCDDDDDDDDDYYYVNETIPDAIVSALCTNGSSLHCNSGNEVLELCPFDQPATGASFRTFTFPWSASTGDRSWVFFADRRFANDNSCSAVPNAPGIFSGKPRIVAMSTIDGINWVGGAASPGTPIVLADRPLGFQVMPSATGIKGRIDVAWWDTVREETDGLPAGNNDILINDYVNGDTRVFRRADVYTTRLRAPGCSSTDPHAGCTPVIESPVRVSQYPFQLNDVVNNGELEQVGQEVKAHLSNLRLYASGTLAFKGDYIAIVGRPARTIADGSWIGNYYPQGARGPEEADYLDRENVFVAWGDNQDVVADYEAPSAANQLPYTPTVNSAAGRLMQKPRNTNPETVDDKTLLADKPAVSAELVADGVADDSDDPLVPADTSFGVCQPSFDFSNSRNANIYGTEIVDEPTLTASITTKPLTTFQRMFPIQMSNPEEVDLEFCLVIGEQPADAPLNGRASFVQLPAVPPFTGSPAPITELDVSVPALSSASRSVFVVTGVSGTQVPVRAFEGSCAAPGPLVSSVVVGDSNQLADPEYCAAPVPADRVDACLLVAQDETHNISLVSPNLQAPILQAPILQAPILQAPILQAPILQAPNLQAPILQAPILQAPILQAPILQAPILQANQLLAPNLQAPNLQAPILQAPILQAAVLDGDPVVYQDVSFIVDANANVTTTYSADIALGLEPRDAYVVQLVAWTPNEFAVAQDCVSQPAADKQVIAAKVLTQGELDIVDLPETVSENQQNPYAGEVTFTGRPGQRIAVTARIYAAGPAADTLTTLSGDYEDCLAAANGDVSACANAGIGGLLAFGSSAHSCSTNALPNPLDPEDCLDAGSEKILDSDPPEFNLPADTTLAFEANLVDGAVIDLVGDGVVLATDRAGDVPVLCSLADGGGAPVTPLPQTLDVGSYPVVCEAADLVGNVGTLPLIADVVDSVFPEIVLVGAANPSIEAGAAFTDPGATATDLRGSTTLNLTSAVTVSGSVDTGTPGTYELVYSVSDGGGNVSTVTRTVVVVDTTPPSLTGVPAVIANVEATGGNPDAAIATWAAPSASDIVDGDVAVSCSPASGSFFPLGLTIVSCSASDAAGNTASQTFNVTVVDTTAPLIDAASVPASPLTIDANDPSGWVYPASSPLLFDVQASDIVDGSVPTVCTTPTGTVDGSSSFPFGDTLVSCSATDSAGNSGGSTSFTIRVEDQSVPEFGNEFPGQLSPAPLVYNLDPGANTFTIDWGPFNVSDVADPDGITVSCDVSASDSGVTALGVVGPIPPSPPYTFSYAFPVGNTTITCKAEDSAGNKAEDSFSIEVFDVTGPVITLADSNPLVVEASSTGSYVEPGVAAVEDAVDGDLDASSVVIGGAVVDLATPGDYVVTYTAVDSRGNETVVEREVQVRDTTPPSEPLVISVPADTQLSPTGDILKEATAVSTPVNWNIVSTDNLGTPSVVCAPSPGSGFSVGTTEVICTATDSANLSTASMFDVIVQDTTAPIATAPADIIGVEATGPTTVVDIGAATATDAVGVVSITSDAPAGGNYPVGTTTVTWTALDAAGNSGSDPQHVTVVDTTAPQLAASNIEVALGASVDWIAAAGVSATDLVDGSVVADCYIVNPDDPTDTSDNQSPRLFDSAGTLSARCDASDEAGNTVNTGFEIVVGFPFAIELHVSKLSAKAGSSIPIEWRYRDPATGALVNSSGFNPEVSWFGPFHRNDRSCGNANDMSRIGDDAGSSDKRYDAGSKSWKFNWKTPNLRRKNILLVITPTGAGDPAATECVRLK